MLNLWDAWVGVAILIASSVGAWAGARALLRTSSVPFLPERLFDYSRAVGLAGFLALMVAVAATRLDAVVGFALMQMTLVAGIYPLRGPLYLEGWRLPRYLLFQARVILAFQGYWLLLALAPQLVAAASVESRWLAAQVLVSVILLWATFYLPLMAALIGARRLRDVTLQERFDGIVVRARAPRPVILEVRPRDGSFWNAVAFRGRMPCVLFGGAVIDALTADEATAVFAHELAHIEQGIQRRWQRMASALLLIAGVLACAAAARFRPSSPTPGLMWALLVGFAYRRLRANSQHWEIAADRRAAELCGDAALVAQALTRLHAFARLPRRWASEFQRHASHPDLAMRVAALQPPVAAPTGAPPVLVPFAEPAGAALVVDGSTCHWLLEHDGALAVSVEAWRRAGRAFRSFTRDQIEELAVTPSPAAIGVALATAEETLTGVVAVESVERLEQALGALDARVRVRYRSGFQTATRILRAATVGASVIVGILIGLVLVGITLSL